MPHPLMQSGAAVTLVDVSKYYGARVAVDALSLEVPRGCVYGFLGPNGAGKTTTFRLLTGILQPDAGSVTVLGQPPAEVRARFGYMPEERGLYRRMRVQDLLIYMGRLKGLSRAAAARRTHALLAEFDMTERAKQRCDQLSKGLAQKVQMISTLLHEPELLILDEPYSGLDPVNVQFVQDTIRELRNAGKTVILSTHAMEQAEQICDAILLIDAGRKLIDGPLRDICESGPTTVRIDYQGDGALLHELPGVAEVRDTGRHAEITLSSGGDPQMLLRAAQAQLRIHRFDCTRASLQEVFVRAVSVSVYNPSSHGTPSGNAMADRTLTPQPSHRATATGHAPSTTD